MKMFSSKCVQLTKILGAFGNKQRQIICRYYVHKRLPQIVRDVIGPIYEEVNLEDVLKLCELTRSWIYTNE